MVNWENTEYVNPRQRKMKDLETGKIYTFEIQDDPDNIVKQSQTPVRAENLNKMQTDLVDDMSKDYTGTNITADTVEGYGIINKLYGDTVQTGTGDKSPDNPYKIECVGDDINLLSDIEKVNASMGSGVDFYGITYFVQVEPSTDYIISFRTSIGYQLSEYNNDKTVIKQEAKNFNTKFTTSANTYYIKFRTNSLVSEFSSVPLIKLQKGAIATPYSPPNKGTVVVKSSNSSNTSSTIVYVGKPLCCLKDAEGNIVLQDYIDYKRGKVIRQCGYKILNGSESWFNGGMTDWQNKDYLFWTKIDDIAESNYNISNQYTLTDINTVVNNTSVNYKFARYTAYSSSYNIVFLDKNSADVEAFKQKLAKNNMILVYKLATPIEEDIECTDKIIQYEGSTTIQSDAKIDVTLNNNKAISQIYENIEDTYKRNTKNQVITDNFSASTGTIQSLFQYRNGKYVTVMLNIKFSSTAGQYFELGRLKLKPIDVIAMPAPILNHQAADGYNSCNIEMLFTGNNGIIALRTLKAYTNAYVRVYLTYLTNDV